MCSLVVSQLDVFLVPKELMDMNQKFMSLVKMDNFTLVAVMVQRIEELLNKIVM